MEKLAEEYEKAKRELRAAGQAAVRMMETGIVDGAMIDRVLQASDRVTEIMREINRHGRFCPAA